MKHFLFIFAAAACFSSCSIQDVDLVRVNSVYPETVVGDAPRLTVNARLNNPNKFNIKVKKAKINLLINGNDAGDITLGDHVVLEKLKEDDYTFILVGEKEKIVSAITASGIAVALSRKVNITIRGWVKGKAFGLGKKIKVEEKKSLSLKDLGINL